LSGDRDPAEAVAGGADDFTAAVAIGCGPVRRGGARTAGDARGRQPSWAVTRARTEAQSEAAAAAAVSQETVEEGSPTNNRRPAGPLRPKRS